MLSSLISCDSVQQQTPCSCFNHRYTLHQTKRPITATHVSQYSQIQIEKVYLLLIWSCQKWKWTCSEHESFMKKKWNFRTIEFNAEPAMKNVIVALFIVVICFCIHSRHLGGSGCRNVKSRFSRLRPPCHTKTRESRWTFQ